MAIYPITPSSDMAQHADAFSVARQNNIWGTVPHVIEMQSEGGAGSFYGATPDRCAHNDLHGIPGFAPDGAERVENRRRVNAEGIPRPGPERRCARTLDLR